jgi:hypothetical protein
MLQALFSPSTFHKSKLISSALDSLSSIPLPFLFAALEAKRSNDYSCRPQVRVVGHFLLIKWDSYLECLVLILLSVVIRSQ